MGKGGLYVWIGVIVGGVAGLVLGIASTREDGLGNADPSAGGLAAGVFLAYVASALLLVGLIALGVRIGLEDFHGRPPEQVVDARPPAPLEPTVKATAAHRAEVEEVLEAVAAGWKPIDVRRLAKRKALTDRELFVVDTALGERSVKKP